MKLALVTQRVAIDPRHGERRDALDQRWAPFLAECGLLAVPVPNTAEVAVGLVERLGPALIMFSGGNDLAAYGGDAPERDETELALLQWGRTRGVPVLGVCRGMQIIQHAFGVALGKVEGHVARRHGLVSAGRPEREVNSYHSFAATGSVPGLEVRAATADGVVEAVQHASEAVAGIMWHPEREDPFHARDVALFRQFLSSGTIGFTP